MRTRALLLGPVALAVVAACSKDDPLYCDEETPCTDPARPYCDLTGEHPASEGIGRTCIPDPFPDGGLGDPADAGPDAAITPPCTWGVPALLANVNSDSYELLPSLSHDGLELYFTRFGDDAGMYVSQRATDQQPFGAPDMLEELSDPEMFEYDPEISSNGLEIFFRWDSRDIRVATRANTSAAWSEPELTGVSGVSPSISGDGLSLYFIADDTVKVVKRTSLTAPFGSPQDVMPADGRSGIDISSDELRILLSGGPNDFDGDPIVVAERASRDEQFGAPNTAGATFKKEGDLSDGAHATWNGDESQIVLPYQFATDPADLYVATCD